MQPRGAWRTINSLARDGEVHRKQLPSFRRSVATDCREGPRRARCLPPLADKLGWDLICTRPNGPAAKVEVKGVSGNRPIVLLTANEIRAAREEVDWVLAVVTRALVEARKILIFDSGNALAAAAPYVYRADMTGSLVAASQNDS